MLKLFVVLKLKYFHILNKQKNAFSNYNFKKSYVYIIYQTLTFKCLIDV